MIFFSFHQLLWLQVLLSLILSPSNALKGGSNIFSVLSEEGEAKQVPSGKKANKPEPSAPKLKQEKPLTSVSVHKPSPPAPKKRHEKPLVNASPQPQHVVGLHYLPKLAKPEVKENVVNVEIPVVYEGNEMDEKIGLIVVGEYIHQRIIDRFLANYPCKGDVSWETVLWMGPTVRAAIRKIQVSEEVFTDAVRLYMDRNDVAHPQGLKLSNQTITAYWKLVKDHIRFAEDRQLIQTVLERRGMLIPNSKYDPFNVQGVLVDSAKLMIAAIELHQYLKSSKGLSIDEYKAIDLGLGGLRNRMAHAVFDRETVKMCASVLRQRKVHVDACEYVLSHVPY